MMTRDDLSRPFVLTVCANGSVHIREPGQKGEPGTLPVFSTNTRDEADALRVRHCRLARDGSGLYFLNDRPTSVDDLGRVSDMFRADFAAPKGIKLTAAAKACALDILDRAERIAR